MKPAELRRNLADKKRELRRSLREKRKHAQEKLESHPMVREARARRRIRRGVIAGILVLLALLSRCECGQPPPAEPVAEAPKEPPKPAPRPAAKPKPKKLQATTDRNDRGAYTGEARAKASWVDEYRLQVAARSSRLSACFTGVDKPGALRWTASLNPETGTVSDHDLEALASSSPIWKKERECLIQALSTPPYNLPADAREAEGIPTRMSIVIEF